MISGLFYSSFNLMAQDNNKPESSLSNKITKSTSTVKQEKPIDALSSKSAAMNDVKKDSSSKELPVLQTTAVLSDKKKIK